MDTSAAEGTTTPGDLASVASQPIDGKDADRIIALSEEEAHAWLHSRFMPGQRGRVGAELEMLVGVAGTEPFARHYPREGYQALVESLGLNGLEGRLTLEPGGQVELSSSPASSLVNLIGSVQRDLALIDERAARQGARLLGVGLDPARNPRRILRSPRYDAMESYFRPWQSAGRAMMCSSASIQVNVECGTDALGIEPRWELLHAIGPALVAAFANSPYFRGRLTGWKSTRQSVWQRLDPARTGTPPRRRGETVADGFARWALDASLMVVRRSGQDWSAPSGVSFRDWIHGGDVVVPGRTRPTIDDLAYHASTLFPHIRPKGYFEVRYIDALPGLSWIVPVAVIAALIEDTSAADRAMGLCAPSMNRWADAARFGMDDQEIARSAEGILAVAASSLRRHHKTVAAADRVEAYMERWTTRRRSPADDMRIKQ